jgi:hypothetical protein
MDRCQKKNPKEAGKLRFFVKKALTVEQAKRLGSYPILENQAPHSMKSAFSCNYLGM